MHILYLKRSLTLAHTQKKSDTHSLSASGEGSDLQALFDCKKDFHKWDRQSLSPEYDCVDAPSACACYAQLHHNLKRRPHNTAEYLSRRFRLSQREKNF